MHAAAAGDATEQERAALHQQLELLVPMPGLRLALAVARCAREGMLGTWPFCVMIARLSSLARRAPDT